MKMNQKEEKQKRTRTQKAKTSSRSKKSENKPNDLPSLQDLRDKEKFKDIDDRIESLKLELSSLLGEKCNAEEPQDTSCNSDVIALDKSHFKEDFVEQNTYDSVIEITDDTSATTQSVEGREAKGLNPKTEELVTQSNKSNKKNLSLEDLSLTSSDRCCKSRFPDMSQLPQREVERLIYESFLMQQFGTYTVNSDDDDEPQEIKSSKPRKQNHNNQKKKPHKQTTSQKRKTKRLICKRKRQRTLPMCTSFGEVIDVEKENMNPGGSGVQNRNVNLDVDVQNCDWSEPFELDDNTGNTESYLSGLDMFGNCTIEIEDCELLEKPNPGGSTTSDFPGMNNIIDVSENVPEAPKKKVWECPICFEHSTGQEVVATVCGHIFCKTCLDNHCSKMSRSCPSCRTDLQNKPTITLYNL